jgi:UDP-2,4-diacetamido-2,4,6-trideoxy-beta-L-altropyranose hydrolase
VKPKKRLVFRADGNSEIGLGHLIRSLALANMLKADFNCTFLLKNTPKKMLRDLNAGMDFHQLPSTIPTAEEPAEMISHFVSPDDILVLDGYHFHTPYQQTLKKNGNKVVCIDDIHAFPFVADAIINVAGGVNPAVYAAEPHTRFLFGPAYSLLRKPFLEAAKKPVSEKHLDRIFLNLGGADLENNTLRILQEIIPFRENFSEINLVIGSAYLHAEMLEEFVADKPFIKIHRNLPAAEMCQLMENCGTAICPPSGVSNEYCSVKGLLFLYQTAENQAGINAFLTGNELALPYAELFSVMADPALKKKTAEKVMANQGKYFDGKSPERFLNFFRTL